MLFLPTIPGNPYLRSALWVSKGRSVLKYSRDQQKCASALTSVQRIFRFRSMLERTSQNETRYPGQRKPGRTRPNSDEAGAAPTFDAPCVTASQSVSLFPRDLRTHRGRRRQALSQLPTGKLTGIQNTHHLSGPVLAAAYAALSKWHFKPYVKDRKPQYFYADLVFHMR
jgi:hypothetical protein